MGIQARAAVYMVVEMEKVNVSAQTPTMFQHGSNFETYHIRRIQENERLPEWICDKCNKIKIVFIILNIYEKDENNAAK